jgi:hypothetical protein
MHRSVDRVFHNFMSQLQEVIPQVIMSEKCYTNMGMILSGYRAIGRES